MPAKSCRPAARVCCHGGLTPAGPSSLPNRPDSRRFVSSLSPHRARPALAACVARHGPPGPGRSRGPRSGGPVCSTPSQRRGGTRVTRHGGSSISPRRISFCTPSQRNARRARCGQSRACPPGHESRRCAEDFLDGAHHRKLAPFLVIKGGGGPWSILARLPR